LHPSNIFPTIHLGINPVMLKASVEPWFQESSFEVGRQEEIQKFGVLKFLLGISPGF
jgi:hypothetical protein